ncbi:MAG TPA: ABC transporter ATP-binding protein [Candidatus Acidoferrum sp.]|nr:ABC transporter ATP-binding protein [Candidatus Acidoferrum sp.]
MSTKLGGSITKAISPNPSKAERDGKFSLFRLLRPRWLALTIAFIAVLGETATDVLDPWPIKVVIDNVLPSKSKILHPHWLARIVTSLFGHNKLAILEFAVAAVLAIAVVGAISSYIERYLTTSISQWVSHDLRRTLYHHIQRLSLTDFNHTRTGDLITRVTSDIESIQDFLDEALLGMVVNFLTLVGMIGVMLYINWRFTLIALSVAPVLLVVVYTFTRRIKQASRAVRKKESQLLSVVEEVLTSVRIVKAFAREDYEQKRFESKSLENVETALEARGVKAKLSPFVEMIIAVGTCLVLWYGARLVLAGHMDTGVLVVFLLYLGRMYKPMRQLSKMTDTVSKALVGYERIKEVVKIESRVRDLPHARKAPRFRGEVEFDHVTFGYDDDTVALKDFSFHIKPGQIAALVGPSGTGKTTAISLIPRFYEPSSGCVKIDGRDTRQFTLKSLREQMSFVLQETLLFRATIWDNIAYGRPDASRAQILRAAKLANAHEFIEKMPDGYDTIVGERGATLSGGQRQRIAIARAVIRDTPLLILDEPTTGLDSASEAAVIEALDRLMKDRTTIVIAHHLQTIRNADIIFVMKDSELVESGTHDGLLTKHGFYAELFEAQTPHKMRGVSK